MFESVCWVKAIMLESGWLGIEVKSGLVQNYTDLP